FIWDRKGILWIPTPEGFTRFEGGEFTRYPAPPGMGSDLSRICEDSEGNLWQAAWGYGVIRFRDGRYTAFTKRDGLRDDRLSSICVDREGSVWFGSMGGGLGRLRDAPFTSYAQTEGLTNVTPSHLLADRQGNIWIDDILFKDGQFTRMETLTSP